MDYLRDLVEETGQSFGWPQTSSQASMEIRRLLAVKKTSRAGRRRERQATSFAERSGDAARVRDDELTGYGSTAAWAGRA